MNIQKLKLALEEINSYLKKEDEKDDLKLMKKTLMTGVKKSPKDIEPKKKTGFMGKSKPKAGQKGGKGWTSQRNVAGFNEKDGWRSFMMEDMASNELSNINVKANAGQYNVNNKMFFLDPKNKEAQKPIILDFKGELPRNLHIRMSPEEIKTAPKVSFDQFKSANKDAYKIGSTEVRVSPDEIKSGKIEKPEEKDSKLNEEQFKELYAWNKFLAGYNTPENTGKLIDTGKKLYKPNFGTANF